MTIALTADDTRKELLIQFCTAYAGILSPHKFIATGTTGRLISNATGLNVDCLLPGPSGGFDQLLSHIQFDEVDMLIAFRDCRDSSLSNSADLLRMTRICDLKNIPTATSLATAEMLVLGLANGDLDWRIGLKHGAPII